jgi:hypothetical protein
MYLGAKTIEPPYIELSQLFTFLFFFHFLLLKLYFIIFFKNKVLVGKHLDYVEFYFIVTKNLIVYLWFVSMLPFIKLFQLLK